MTAFHKICLLHLNQIGDLVFSLPLIQNLRSNFPEAEIHSVIKPYLVELLEDVPHRVIPRKDGINNKLALVKRLRGEEYDLVISLTRSEECMLIAALSGARHKAGFRRPPLDIFLDTKISLEGHYCWHNNRRLLKELGMTITKDDYCGLLKAAGSIDEIPLPDHFAVVSPGASRRRLAKCWDNQKFAELMAGLHAETDLSFVLVGSEENVTTNEMITNTARTITPGIRILNQAGKLRLNSLCSLLRKASLFVGIDSGAMHLASSLELPTLGLFGPSDPVYVGPQNERSIVVRNEGLDCMPCYFAPCKHLDCMGKLRVETVLQACENLLCDSR